MKCFSYSFFVFSTPMFSRKGQPLGPSGLFKRGLKDYLKTTSGQIQKWS